jgi:nicotinamidase-related amidase
MKSITDKYLKCHIFLRDGPFSLDLPSARFGTGASSKGGEKVRKTLLVIDMLNDFLDPEGALFCGDEARKIIPVIGGLLNRFLELNHQVVYLRDAHAGNDKEFELFPPHAVKGTWGSEIIPELKPPQGCMVVDKTRFSAFYGNNLAEILAAAGPHEVWVTGVCTSICVMDTTGDLRNRDYSTVIPIEAVADFDPEFHDFALRRMKRVYGADVLHLFEAEKRLVA